MAQWEWFFEWGASLFACDGHIIIMGHADDPSDELLDVLAQGDPDCAPGDFEPGTACIWEFPAFIPAGMPLFKSSGYGGGFDFGLSLVGLTAEELREQPGYGYSIIPWRVKAGNSVCPLEYFPEPFRSQYLKKLGVYKCGPFNQDVPGTAMGVWLITPSPDKRPGGRRKRVADDNEVIWLFEISSTPTRHRMTVGNTIFGMEYGQFSYTYRDSGLVNRRWDSVMPGEVYCVEINRQINFGLFGDTIESVLILKLSEDAKQLTFEAIDQDGCSKSHSFRGGQRTFYR